jgi:hypothetical protein
VEVVPAAAGADGAPRMFYEQPNAGEHSSLSAAWVGSVRGRQADGVTVDALIDRRGWGSVDFLKIDTEGYDAHVLAGTARALRAHRISVVQFEYNRPWRDAGRTLCGALRFLQAIDYDVYVLRPERLEPYDYGVFGEFFSYANFVAISPSSRVRPILGLV